jgi:hypothetical protein
MLSGQPELREATLKVRMERWLWHLVNVSMSSVRARRSRFQLEDHGQPEKKAISGIPKGIAADIERLNALRNAVAHSLFPENLKRQKPIWKGKVVFTQEGFASLEGDIAEIHRHFRDVFQEARNDAEGRVHERRGRRNGKALVSATTAPE